MPTVALMIRPALGTLAPLEAGAAALFRLRLGSKDAGTVRAYRRDLDAFATFAGFDTAAAALDAFLVLDAGAAHAAALVFRDGCLSAIV